MYKNLKALRQSLNMSQKEFAASLDIGYTTYNGYETGAREPKSDFWIKVASKYGVTIDYLMGYTNAPHKTTDRDSIEYSHILNQNKPLSELEQEIIEIFLRLDDRARSALLGYANRLIEEARNNPAKQDTTMDIDSQLERYRRGMLMGIATAQADFSLPPEDIDVDSIALTPELKAIVDSRMEELRCRLEAEQQKKQSAPNPTPDGTEKSQQRK